MQSRKKRSTLLFYSVYLAVFTLVIIFGFISQIRFDFQNFNVIEFFYLLSLFNFFGVELIIAVLLGFWLLPGGVIKRILLYLFIVVYISVYCLQLGAFYIGGEFVSRLAVDNLNHIGILINRDTIIGVVVCGILCLFPVSLLESMRRRRRYASRDSGRSFGIVVAIFVLVLLLVPETGLLPKAMERDRNHLLQTLTLQHSAPLYALIDTLIIQKELSLSRVNTKFTPRERAELKKFGFHLNSEQNYPLMWRAAHSLPAPFSKKQKDAEPVNLIIVFTEGFSARAMKTYHSLYPDLTPNLDRFASQSMVVRNYFNHTAATYRGLHGQLCSLYPTYGGMGGWQTDFQTIPMVNYDCLPDRLEEQGYETIFLDAHKKNEAYVDEMMLRLGFNRVLTAENCSTHYLNGAEPLMKFSLSDKQLFSSLVGFLENRATNRQLSQPFLIGLYNLGTHAWLPAAQDGIQYADGRSGTLNTIHSYDAAFGLFWDYFQTSPYADNTAVILTADHCHYSDKAFIEVFDEPGYQPIFVDRIPLIIYDQTRNLPASFDAGNSTSLDFTPSLLHYLGIAVGSTAFLGNSIFGPQKEYSGYGVANIGEGELYLLDGVKIHKRGVSEKYRKKLNILDKFIRYEKYLELNNKLYNKKK